MLDLPSTALSFFSNATLIACHLLWCFTFFKIITKLFGLNLGIQWKVIMQKELNWCFWSLSGVLLHNGSSDWIRDQVSPFMVSMLHERLFLLPLDMNKDVDNPADSFIEIRRRRICLKKKTLTQKEPRNGGKEKQNVVLLFEFMGKKKKKSPEITSSTEHFRYTS